MVLNCSFGKIYRFHSQRSRNSRRNSCTLKVGQRMSQKRAVVLFQVVCEFQNIVTYQDIFLLIHCKPCPQFENIQETSQYSSVDAIDTDVYSIYTLCKYAERHYMT